MMPYFNSRMDVWRPADTGRVCLAIRVLAIGVLAIVLGVEVSDGAEESSHAVSHDAPSADSRQTMVEAAHGAALPVSHEPDGSVVAEPEKPQVPYFLQDDKGREPVLGPEQQIAVLTKRGRDIWRWGNHELAEEVFAHALSLAVPIELKRSLLLDLANLYDENQEPLKVAAVLERFRQGFPGDRLTPQVLLKLGLIYRESGTYDQATQRFFQVLNSTLQAPPEDMEENRRLAMKARLEIAATYDMQGKFAEAEKYFSRVQLFDLDPEDRERVQFRSAQLVSDSKAWLAAEKQLGAFLEQYPSSVHVPEARYLRAKALNELNRKDEAVQEVLAILTNEYVPDTELARQAAYWGRRTGNEFANQLYEQGDFLGALSIYQALARANDDPAWRWPAIYQVGLCFERLRLPVRAHEAYELIVSPEGVGASEKKLSDTLAALQSMARWRLEHLVWVEDFSERLQALSAEKKADS